MFDSCICIDVDESVTILTDKLVTARKVHVCIECGFPIMPDQKYRYESGVFEGEMVEYKTCIPCFRVRESLFKCGFYYAGVWGVVHESYCGHEDEDYVCICPNHEDRVSAWYGAKFWASSNKKTKNDFNLNKCYGNIKRDMEQFLGGLDANN